MMMNRLVVGLAVAFGVAQSARAQRLRPAQFEAGIAAFIPARSLGQHSGFEGRVGAGTDLRLALEAGPSDGALRVRIGVDVVPATSTRLRPTADCGSDCQETTVTTWIVVPGADLVWTVPGGDHLALLAGVGLAVYAHPIGDCVDLSGTVCLSGFPYTENAKRGTFRVGAQLRASRSSATALEVSDSATPIDQGNVQSDIRIGIVMRF